MDDYEWMEQLRSQIITLLNVAKHPNPARHARMLAELREVELSVLEEVYGPNRDDEEDPLPEDG